ncbi:nuclear transport factor 2 family protein [Mangrovivirga sp. M17]|uniref:Nuclear transport factor 2 family protein n=1 Tax=Mangrovivirga halotolerans TaxID=2993936 RepID=A0ABT3RNF8_9BACT|nr:nuclear transport factor 2 family protein [Mangrovivirga halotolerans]MCX2743345.1 nuclear transport factor 2 family protein [Mangrovivirga halotolerans]
MKKICLFLLLIVAIFSGYSQDSETSDEQQIKNVINLFFKSLETRDTVLMKQTTMVEAQIWRRRNYKQPVEVDMRFSKDDLPLMPTDPKITEIPTRVDVLAGEGIAVAYAPYNLWEDGEFSHCGIDVFTLFEINGHWKIVSTAYTVERENCDESTGEN